MNNLGIVQLQDEGFNISQTAEMILLIKIAPKRISYAIINERDNRLLVLYDAPLTKSIKDTIDDLFSEKEYLQAGFSRTKVSVQTSRFTFIPTKYFINEDLAVYEKLILADESTKTYLSTIDGSFGTECIVALERTSIEKIEGTFSDVRIFSQAEPLIKGSLRTQNSTLPKLILQFNYDSFEAYYTTEGQFIFYNLFIVENADDFNYFLINIIQQLSIEPENTAIILSGNIVIDDENYKRIEKYFADIRFADSSKITNYSPAFNQLPKHLHFSLLSLLLCV